MNNLTKKTLFQSTVFQYSILVDLFAAGIFMGGDITGLELLGAITTGFGLYVAKEGVAKGAEAYRDKGED